MQIVNYLRATVFKSSYAALDLAMKNQKYSELAKNIVSVKQSNAVSNLIISHSDQKKFYEFSYKINKYNFILKKLLSIGHVSLKTTDTA